MENTYKRANHWLIKMVAILAACVLLLAGVALLRTSQTASATQMGDQTLALSNVSVSRGEEFDVDLSIANNDGGIQAIRLLVTFDTSRIELVGVQAKNPTEQSNWTGNFTAAGGNLADYGSTASPFVLLWVSTSKLYGNGTIATLTFLSKPEPAPTGNSTIAVDVDENSTLVGLGQKRDLAFSGGAVTVLPGKYAVKLLDANGDQYAYKESNTSSEDVTIEAALLEDQNGANPTKDADSKYSYTFRGWRKVQEGAMNVPTIYEPTFDEDPVSYDITFVNGIMDEGESTIRYSGANTSSVTNSVPYGTILDYEGQAPAAITDYTFLGWYSNEECTTPVTFATMPDSDQTVYGYYRFNADEPGVITAALDVAAEEDGKYIVATVSVTQNYGFNSIRFVPTFDAAKVDFVGFLYESDSPFFGAVAPTFPDINDDIKADADVTNVWQTVAANESIADKDFLFLSSSQNTYVTGKLLKMKFVVKDGWTAGDDEIGVSIVEKGLTRFVANGDVWYANAQVAPASVNVLRVVKPTAYTALEKTYTYTGESVVYEFKTAGGSNYYEVTYSALPKNVNDYVAYATLKTVENTVVTWEDGSIAPLEFAFAIDPFTVTKPELADITYTYTGSEQTVAFTAASSEHSNYYTVEGGTQTAAGEHTVTVSLKDDENTEWAGGTTADLTFPFVIGRKKIVKPTAYSASEKTYTYNHGANIEYEFKAEDANDKSEYTVSGDTVVTTAGEDYTVVVTLKDTANTEWADDDQTVDTDPLNYTFAVGKLLLPTPVVNSKEYSGEPQTADIDLPQNSPYEVTENAGGTDEGTYDVVFTFKSGFFANYGWEDSATDSVTAEFCIVNEVNVWTLAPYVTSKVYDGAPAAYGALARKGSFTVTYRLQSLTDNDYSADAPVDAGSYYARFFVPAAEEYADLIEVVSFEITKVRLDAPVAYTDDERTYTYTGSEQTYAFKDAGDTTKYEVTNATRTVAGSQTVTVSLKDKTNYIWKGATQAEDTVADQTYTFVIGKASLTVPVAAVRTYVYNGTEQTFEFSVAGDTDKYTLAGNKRTDAGSQTVTASLKDKDNYQWAGATTADQTYEFVIMPASLTAATGGEGSVTVTVATAAGFNVDSTFVVTKASPNIQDFLATIAAATKTGALGQLTDEEAANRVAGKCLVASLVLNLQPAAGAGTYTYSVTLPSARTGAVVIRFVGENVEVFDTTANGNVVSFVSDEVGNFIVLANHSYTLEVADARYLKSAADCENAAVYYKSCACGEAGEETFVYGEALGHDYDFENITWAWSENHLTATATVVCKRNAEHAHIFPTTVTVVERVVPGKDTSGHVTRDASFTYGTQTYTDRNVETLPADGHIYSSNPAWSWREAVTTYSVKATFTCDCGENKVELPAEVQEEVTLTKIIYTAKVVFQGEEYTAQREIERPVVVFDFNDGVTTEVSTLAHPGDTVVFEEAPDKEDFLFIGWRDGNGAVIVKDQNGEYFDYKVGFKRLVFTAVWKNLATVNVKVVNSEGTVIAGASVCLYEGDTLKFSGVTSTLGTFTVTKVPYGNYKLVVTTAYKDGTDIVRSGDLDVDVAQVNVSVRIPNSKFNTIIEGDGSAEGLDDVITDDEKDKISDDDTPGTINEIIIMQKRVTTVSEEIKQEIIARVNRDDQTGRSTVTDFYDVTIIKTTKARNSEGTQFIRQESITVAANYQTNIFPLTAELRNQIAAIGGNVDNAFVYKRHVYDTGVVVIYPIPKVTEAEGEEANFECYFIKRVAGEEYIAIRQKEYSVLALGVSPDPVLLDNEITSLTLQGWTYGDAPTTPVLTAKYGAANAVFTYSATEDGEYSATVPTAAGTYYVKAYIPATDLYGSAVKVVSFTIGKKSVSDLGVKFEDKKFWFNGKKHCITVSGELPEGVEVVYIGNCASDIGKYVVTAVFTSTNPNFDASVTMTAMMTIRLNWVPIIILIVLVFCILVALIIGVEKVLKSLKKGGSSQKNKDGSSNEEDSEKEGSNND